MLHTGDRALIDTDSEVAITGREDRTHDLLRLDHVTKETEVVNLPGELSAKHIR